MGKRDYPTACNCGVTCGCFWDGDVWKCPTCLMAERDAANERAAVLAAAITQVAIDSDGWCVIARQALSASGAEVVRRYLDRASGRVYQQKVRDSEVECFVVTLKPGAGGEGVG